MRAVMVTLGSTGDIFPVIGFAVGLKNAGHLPVVATNALYRDEVERAGVEFAAIPPRWSKQDLSYWVGRLQSARSPLGQLNELYQAIRPHLGEIVDAVENILDGADVLVSSYLFPVIRCLADRRGIPFASFAFAHNTVPSAGYSLEGLPGFRFPGNRFHSVWNRLLWKVGERAVDVTISRTTRQVRASRGIPAIKNFFSGSAKLVLVGVSPALIKPGCRIDPRFRFVGYCRWQCRQNPSLEMELDAFLNGERVPILTFGSMICDNRDAWMDRFLRHWPPARKLVLQRGWAGFAVPPGYPQIKVVDEVSHDRLFRHGSVVIHHGGAGTTASVLHAGKPQIVIPHIADQFFFGREIERLGTGVTVLRKHWPERLAAVVDAVLADPSYAKRAEELKHRLLLEDGPATAAAVLEEFVASRKKPPVCRDS